VCGPGKGQQHTHRPSVQVSRLASGSLNFWTGTVVAVGPLGFTVDVLTAGPVGFTKGEHRFFPWGGVSVGWSDHDESDPTTEDAETDP
jgi:hypothetical protein